MSSSNTNTQKQSQGGGLVDAFQNFDEVDMATKLFGSDQLSQIFDEKNSWSESMFFGIIYHFVGSYMHTFEIMSPEQLIIEFETIWSQMLMIVFDLFMKYSPRTEWVKELKKNIEINIKKTKVVQNEQGQELVVKDTTHIQKYTNRLMDCMHKCFKSYATLIKEKNDMFWSSQLNPSVKWFEVKNFAPKEVPNVPHSIEEVWFNILTLSSLQPFDPPAQKIWSQINYLASFTLAMKGVSETNRHKAFCALQSLLKDTRETHERKEKIDFLKILPVHLAKACDGASAEDKKELLHTFLELFKTLIKPTFQGAMRIFDQIPGPARDKIDEQIRIRSGKPRFRIASIREQFDSSFEKLIELIESIPIDDLLNQSEKVSELLAKNKDVLTPDCLKSE